MGRKTNKPKTHGKTFFFAYQSTEKSGSCNNADAFRAAAESLNGRATTWEKMFINGRFVHKQIFSEIDKASYFVCDLTYQNENVFFELGYAIAKKKPVFIFVNTKVKEAVNNYTNTKFLKTIGYSNFANAPEIVAVLRDSQATILMNQMKFSQENIVEDGDVFYIQASSNSQAEIDLKEYLEDSEYIVNMDDKEIAYETLEWYVEQINKHKALIVHLSSPQMQNAQSDNAKNSFYAGLGFGMGKQVILLAPSIFRAPLDYTDILLDYSKSSECMGKVDDWLLRIDFNRKVFEEEKKEKEANEDVELNLFTLGLGYAIAEKEKEDLLEYFVETYAYHEALKTDSAIFHGRKGVGKTALFIKLRDDYEDADDVFLITLKPESDELLNGEKLIEKFENENVRKKMMYSIWRQVIYSKLILKTKENIKDKRKYQYSTIEEAIMEFCEKNEHLLELDFMNALLEQAKYSTGQITDLVVASYSKDILSKMENLIFKYFGTQKYGKIVVMADNLDKAWESTNNLIIQSEMILVLLEVVGKIQNDLHGKGGIILHISVIIFLRTDILNYILLIAREPDKMLLSIHEVEWRTYSNLLRQLVEKRMRHVLGISEKEKMDSTWEKYFDLNEDPVKLVQEVCILRPRDVLIFFARMFESAFNNCHKKATIEDFNNAKEHYSILITTNLEKEMCIEFPYIGDFLKKYNGSGKEGLELVKFKQLVSEIEINPERREKFIEKLFENEYLLAVVTKDSKILNNYKDVIELEQQLNGRFKIPFINYPYILIKRQERYTLT